MSKYEVIKNIMENEKLNENDKVFSIEMFLKGWWTEEHIKKLLEE